MRKGNGMRRKRKKQIIKLMEHQTDPHHREDNKLLEHKSFDLPDNMELDDKEVEDNFEEGGDNGPESMPDFEDEIPMD